MERHNGIEPDPEGAFVYYADAQATVEALQRENECKDTLIATLQAQFARQAQEGGVGE